MSKTTEKTGQTTQQPFEPVAGTHSVAEFVIFFEFSDSFKNVMSSLDVLQDDYKDFFPTLNKIPGYQFQINNDGVSNTPESLPPVLEFKRLGDNNTLPEWILRITTDALAVHCTKYTRWDEIWPLALGLLEKAFGRMSKEELLVTSVGMRYLDQFDFLDESEDAYNVKNLFNPSSEFLNSSIFSCGNRWHAYTGFFEPHQDLDTEILNQINIDSVRRQLLTAKGVSITIGHIMKVQINNEKLINHFTPATPDGVKKFSALMDFMHLNNRKILNKLLVKAVREKIGLPETSK